MHLPKEKLNNIRTSVVGDVQQYGGVVKGFVHEFKEFAMRGNVMDLAIGIIIGGAFNKIVSSLVADIVTPLLGILIGGIKFDGLKFTLREATEASVAITVNYGVFLQTTIDFIIVAFAVFLLVKAINRFRRKQEKKQAQEDKVTPPPPSKEEVLLGEIRDILKSNVRN
ncbi:MAG TPA: large-conductance mechanosensitive channel protein MscL [Candidatus Paceibacterota bacterium]|nr:large-conductance mechanosensitive channel protein MscL [Candidatus Paceibacterota bacterium]